MFQTLAYFWSCTSFTTRNNSDSFWLAFIQSVVVLLLFCIDKDYVFFIYGLIEIAKSNRYYGIYLSDFLYVCWATIFTGRNTGDSFWLAFIQSFVVLLLFCIEKDYRVLYLWSHRNGQIKKRLCCMSVRLFHISAAVQYLLVEIPVTHFDWHLFNQSLPCYDFASIKNKAFFIYGFIEICKLNRDYGICL